MILISNSEDEGKMLPKLPADLLMHKRVIRECREFDKNLIVSITWKKEVAKSRVNGVNIEFDGMNLATILNIPENNGICDYTKEVREESKYCKPLQITRKFTNNKNIVKARIVKSMEMKPFQRLLQIFVMKNLVPRFGKRDVTSFMDLTYMDYLWTKKKGEHIEKQADKDEDSGTGEKFYDVVDDKRAVDEDTAAPAVEVPASAVLVDPTSAPAEGKITSSGVDPSSSLTDYDLLHLQAKFARALQGNTRFQELYQKM
ncbi:hypothetical protein Dimus_006137 [Dionaea muscipula]